jgi:hypothetical protein
MSATITLNFDPGQPDEAGAVLDAFSYLATELQRRGVTATVLSPDVLPVDDDPALDPSPDPPDPAPVQAQTGTKRVRDRTAERRAAKEKAEAEARAKAQGNGAAADADDPLLGASDGPGAGDPFADEDDAAPAPPGPASKQAVQDKVRTPKECMDGAVVLLRQVFPLAGGGDAVKALQKVYKVSKFIDVPLAQAPGLWKEALALAQKFKVNIPAGL